MEEFPNKPKQKAEGIRSWRAEENDVDKAVGAFLHMTRYEGAARKDAFEQTTKDLSSKKLQDFLERLAVAEKTDPKTVSVERVALQKKESFDEKKVVSAIRAFHARAVAVPSDMPVVFDEVSSELKLSPSDKNELAKRIMGMFTGRDLQFSDPPHDQPEELDDEGSPALSEGSVLIPRDEMIDDLSQKIDPPQGVAGSVVERLRNRKARIHVNDDGTAYVVGEKRPRRRGRGRREAGN